MMLPGFFLFNLARHWQEWWYRKCHKDHLQCVLCWRYQVHWWARAGRWRAGSSALLWMYLSVFGLASRPFFLSPAPPGPAASLTDDLQLARLARAAAVATAVVLLAVATGLPSLLGLGRCCSRSVKIWRSHRQRSVQCSQSPSLQAGLSISPVNSNG